MREIEKWILFSKMMQIKKKIQGLCHLIILEERVTALKVIVGAVIDVIEVRAQLLSKLMRYKAIKEIIIRMKN